MGETWFVNALGIETDSREVRNIEWREEEKAKKRRETWKSKINEKSMTEEEPLEK